MGKFDVRVMACRNLYNKETFGKSDPYVVVSCGDKKYKTTTKKNTLNPSWEEKFTFMIADPETTQLQLEVWDNNMVRDEKMGIFNVSLSGLTKGKVEDNWHILNETKSGEIHIRLMAHDFGRDAAAPKPSAPPASAPPQQYQQPPPQQPPPQQYQQPPPQQYQQPPPQAYPPPQQQQPAGYYPPPATGAPAGYPPQGAPAPGYPPQGGAYPPQGGAPAGYPPQGAPGGYPPQGGGYPPQGGPPAGYPQQGGAKTSYSNEDINGATVHGATINTCDIINSHLTNCNITKADFKGTVTLVNCTVREVDVYGMVTVQGGRFEWGEVKPGGQLVNQGGFVKDIDNYHGY